MFNETIEYKVDDNKIILLVSENGLVDYNKIIKLGSKTSIDIFRLLQNNKSKKSIIDYLSKNFNVTNLEDQLDSFIYKLSETDKNTQLSSKSSIQTNNRVYEELNEYCKNNKIPFKVSIEVSNICNFKCIHCYNSNKEHSTMSLSTFKKHIDDLKLQKCLFLTITGGEPLLLKNFMEYYLYAIKNQMIISLFTNGVFIDKYLYLFKKYPPRKVEITMYGGDDEEYYKITGQKNMFYRVRSNILKLKNFGIFVKVKYITMKQNKDGYYKVKKFCDANDLKLFFDTEIFGAENNNKNLNIEEIIDLNKDKENYTPQYEDPNFKKCSSLFNCSAGLNSAFVDTFSNLKLCPIDTFSKINLLDMEFDKAFDTLGKVHSNQSTFCNSECLYRPFCESCPAFQYLVSKKFYLNRMDEENKYCKNAKLQKEIMIRKKLILQE